MANLDTIRESGTVAPSQLSDGTPCYHEGQTSTYCTKCWTNLYTASTASVAASDAGEIDESRFPKVPFARRVNADTADGVLAIVVMLAPMFLIGANADSLPAGLERLGILGVPLALFYLVFRDAVGRGASLAKDFLDCE